MGKMSKKLNNITNNYYSDEWYTDLETVNKMIELLNPLPNSKIICPFDTEKSYFVKRLKELGHSVIYGIEDFLENHTYEFDYIITNPPFSIKDQVISRCLESRKRTCLVLPVDVLGGVKRHRLYKEYNIKPVIYIPTKRINYYNKNWKKKEGSNFHSIFIVLDVNNKKSEIFFQFEEKEDMIDCSILKRKQKLIKQMNLF